MHKPIGSLIVVAAVYATAFVVGMVYETYRHQIHAWIRRPTNPPEET
jgi:hypothetical protein